MVTPLVHIGYHKTGTTWLQRHLFPNGDAGFTSFSKKEAHNWFVYTHPLDFDVTACQAYFRQPMEDAAARGLVPVITSERLSGNPHSGGFDSKEIADRIKATFPEAKVLMAIREQKGMIASVYKQYIRAGGPCTLNQYLKPPYRGKTRLPLFDFAHFSYHRLIGYYRSLFGPDNVLALPYEGFRQDARAFTERIVQFAGARPKEGVLEQLPYATRVNEAWSGAAIVIHRHLNHLVFQDRINPRVPFPLAKGKKFVNKWTQILEMPVPSFFSTILDRKLKETVAGAVGERYKASNARTAELIGCDLKQYGYDA